mmetsp:Transcript_87837/g.174370  ORF Transcript_87837/g.174370 Transcript_87837/m.174370 type:complete len:92 (-) Transcript_87837:5294-5569(-)
MCPTAHLATTDIITDQSKFKEWEGSCVDVHPWALPPASHRCVGVALAGDLCPFYHHQVQVARNKHYGLLRARGTSQIGCLQAKGRHRASKP